MNPLRYRLHIVVTLVLISTLFACEVDSGIGQFNSLVIDSENNPYKFEQLTLTISLKDARYGYLNLEKLDSLKLFVNAEYWGTYASAVRDTGNLTHRTVDGISYSDHVISYLVVAPFELKADDLTTAGDFVQFLNDRMVLTPGEYVCELREIQYRNTLQESVRQNVQCFAPFKVGINETSAYIGNLSVDILP